MNDKKRDLVRRVPDSQPNVVLSVLIAFILAIIIGLIVWLSINTQNPRTG
jgi:capsular polysaccharide biosynthesis protein